MRLDPRHAAAPLLAGILLAACVPVGQAQIPPTAPAPGASLAGTSAPTYADLATLADTAPLVVHARIRKLARVDDAQARGLKPGTARFYVMADTQALITGRSGIGQSVAYLVDLPLDRRGKPSARKKDEVIVFARSVPGRPGELQLVRPPTRRSTGRRRRKNKCARSSPPWSRPMLRRGSPACASCFMCRATWRVRARRRFSSTPPAAPPPV